MSSGTYPPHRAHRPHDPVLPQGGKGAPQACLEPGWARRGGRFCHDEDPRRWIPLSSPRPCITSMPPAQPAGSRALRSLRAGDASQRLGDALLAACRVATGHSATTSSWRREHDLEGTRLESGGTNFSAVNVIATSLCDCFAILCREQNGHGDSVGASPDFSVARSNNCEHPAKRARSAQTAVFLFPGPRARASPAPCTRHACRDGPAAGRCGRIADQHGAARFRQRLEPGHHRCGHRPPRSRRHRRG